MSFDSRRSLHDALDELVDGKEVCRVMLPPTSFRAVYTLEEIKEREVLDTKIEKLEARIRELEDKQ